MAEVGFSLEEYATELSEGSKRCAISTEEYAAILSAGQER